MNKPEVTNKPFKFNEVIEGPRNRGRAAGAT